MTPEQATQAAKELLDQKRQASLASKNAAAQRVPFFYYVRGLNVLQPWERAEFVKIAAQQVANRWKVVLLAALLVGACCAAWELLGLFSRNVPPVLLIGLIAVIAFIPRTYLVRREVRRLLADREASHA